MSRHKGKNRSSRQAVKNWNDKKRLQRLRIHSAFSTEQSYSRLPVVVDSKNIT